MTIIFGVGATKIAPEADFGTKSVASYEYIETVGPPAEDLQRTHIENEAMLQGLAKDISGEIGAGSESTFGMVVPLRGYDTGVVSAEPALATDITPDARLSASGLGGIYAGGYDGVGIVALGTTDLLLVVTDASSFVDGQAILVNGEIGWVEEVTTGGPETLALGFKLSGIPNASDKVYGTVNIYNIAGYNATYARSLTIEQLGQAADDKSVMLGCRPGSLKISGEPKGHLLLDASFGMQSWARENTGGAPSGLTYAYPAKQQWTGGKCVIYNRTTSTRTEVNCSAIELDMLQGVEPQLNPNAVGGVAEWDKIAVRGVLTIDPFQGTETLVAGYGFEYNAGHAYTIMVQAGTIPGSVVGFVLPCCVQIVEPAKAEREARVARALTFGTLGNTINSAATLDTYTDADPADKEIVLFQA